ncbi:hypothetical protein FHS82_003220 [Pseudochelatococcus lubricantis]|uniref:Uncharacterized protein n=1 Tax=Pseudochelatococcus lubricantis TaxID=1538102 RepID=A0ABX0V6F9_9HYPH|nr:hypothetical protein [Pseudochelatococcus lubricantis]NIJ59365.1 hypothetical protein [Pseudochelatococcus lubricantis]
MTTNDPIRMSDYQRRQRAAIAPAEAARQFRISAVLALVLIAASAIVAAGTLFGPAHTAHTEPPAGIARVS